MAIVSVGDVLDKAGQFEEDLEAYYARIRDETQDNGVKLLTYYFSRHRRHLETALSGCDPAALRRVRGVLLKHSVGFRPGAEHPALGDIPCDETARELLEAAIRHDEDLVSLYKRILEQPVTREAKELFESLIRVEERDIVMMKKMMAMDYF